MTDFHQLTLAGYQQAAAKYLQQSQAGRSQAYAQFLQTVISLVGDSCTGSSVGSEPSALELGSGPGLDADLFEAHGLSVLRSDATPAFVDRLRAQGHRVESLDVLIDDFGGPYHLVFANAVLLHLPPEHLAGVLAKIRDAVRDDGIFAFTVKEGDGEAWSSQKLDLPRYFAYWREPALRTVLAASGWSVISLEHVRGRLEDWLYVICRPAPDERDPVRAESSGDRLELFESE